MTTIRTSGSNRSPRLARRACVTRDGRRLSVESATPIDLSWLSTNRLVPGLDDDGIFRVERRRDLLLDAASPSPHAGLEYALIFGLQKRGFSVEQGRRRSPRPRNLGDYDPAIVPPFGSRDHAFLDFVRWHEEGTIRFEQGKVSPAWLIRQFVDAYPTSTVAVVTASECSARRMSERLQHAGVAVSLLNSRSQCGSLERVVVGTMSSMGHSDVEIERRTAVFFATATDALHDGACDMLMPADARFRLFGFLPLSATLSPYERDRLGAIFGSAELVIPKPGYRLTQVSTAWFPFNGQPIGQHGTTADLFRRAYWQNLRRSQHIARFAREIQSRDLYSLSRASPSLVGAIAQIPVIRRPRVAVLTMNVEHACTIVNGLPTWPLMVGRQCNTSDLTEGNQAILNYRQQLPLSDCFVSTMAGIENDSVADMDVVIWAGGGPHPAPLSASMISYRGTEARQLLLVDVRDRGDPDLVRLSRFREQAYRRLEWFRWGADPMTARLNRYVSQLGGNSADER